MLFAGSYPSSAYIHKLHLIAYNRKLNLQDFKQGKWDYILYI